MRQLRDDTHLRLDGEVQVYRRERSKRWQAAFVTDGQTTILPVNPLVGFLALKMKNASAYPQG